MRAIIIGAGRGKRLMPTTADVPKCFAQVADSRILDWTLKALAENRIDPICFIGGYRIDAVRQAYPQFTFRHNSNWANNNILTSLFYAEDLMDEPFICCYSDTLFTPTVISELLGTEGDIVLSVDTGWQERYAERSEHPTDDAEKVAAINGRVTQIGREINDEEAWGEYTGVARFNVDGATRLKHHFHRCRQECGDGRFRGANTFQEAYLIHLLQEMLETGEVMTHADTASQYIEIDTQQDFDFARRCWTATGIDYE